MDALSALRLEAQTIWGHSPQGLGDGTVTATAVTYDGRSITLAGATPLSPETDIELSAARCWRLEHVATRSVPRGLRLVTTPDGYRPPAQWSATGWEELMRGQRGPWAALVEDDQVVSLAHCARLTDVAAEVGVQTEDAHRGRGLAAVTVAGWAQRMRPLDRWLFYSALEPNDASQRVAGKCGATPLGRLIRLYARCTAA